MFDIIENQLKDECFTEPEKPTTNRESLKNQSFLGGTSVKYHESYLFQEKTTFHSRDEA